MTEAVRGWCSAIDSERRTRAAAVALDVARRAVDPELISAALTASARQTHFPQSLAWAPYRLAEGDAGLAVLCAYLDGCMPDEGWETVGHGFLAGAAQGVERAPELPPGLFGGLSGVCFAAESLSRGGTRYQRLLTSLDAELAPRALAHAESLRERHRPGGVSDFDVISGASGIGAYLLERDPHGVLPEILASLVALATPENGAPRWFTPPDLMADEAMARADPWGNLNCGLAHGIPGPLATLAIALRDGVEVAGQEEAVRALAAWLAAHRSDDEWGVNWPTTVPVPAPGSPEADPASLPPSRSAWCYGSPGIARALWLAGDALGDGELCELAVEAMLAVHRRPVGVRQIESPTFCHGVAGLLQIVLRFANDTGRPEFAEAAAELVDELLAAYEPERPLGYASLEPGRNAVDRAGLLDGAPGVAMVLLAAATDVEPTWDRLFLLS